MGSASLPADGLERQLSGSRSLTSRSDQSYSDTDSDLNLYLAVVAGQANCFTEASTTVAAACLPNRNPCSVIARVHLAAAELLPGFGLHSKSPGQKRGPRK